jgi:hypothetical protein
MRISKIFLEPAGSYLSILRAQSWQILVHTYSIPKVSGRTKKTAAIIKPKVFMPGCFLTLPGVKLDQFFETTNAGRRFYCNT